jgi:hypothetical protein
MPSNISPADRCRFHQIDDQCVAILRQYKNFLMREFDAALERLNPHMASFLNPESQARFKQGAALSKEKYLRHWSIIFDGRLDQVYEDSVKSFYAARGGDKVDARLYIGSYNFLISEMSAGIRMRLPRHSLGLSRARDKVALQSGLHAGRDI